MPKYSFRSKIFVAFLFLVLAFMVLTVLIYGQRIESQLQKETVERAKRNIDLVALLLEERRAAQGTDGLDPWISRIGARLGVRITYMEDGRVLADSNVPSAEVPDMEDHSNRPEVVQAREQAVGIAKRHSATLNRDLIYAARQVPGGVLRVAVPMADVEARRAGMVSALLWSMPFAVLAALGIGFVLSRSLTRSISQFSEAARAIGEGRYGDRLRVYPGSEFKTLADAVNRMASDIQSHIKELQDEQGQRAALFDSLSEGVLVVDSSGAIRDWNPAFARMVSGETLLKGKSLLEVMLEPRLQRLVDEVIKNPEYDGRRMLSFRYGESELELMVEPFQDVAGERKIVVVMRDMTELRRLEAIRSDFVANVSHEMRTPLTNIRGYAETLQDMEELPESCDRFISVIIKNVGQMTRIVSDLLQLTRLEHESGAIESSSVHAPTALNDAFSSLEYAAREKGVRIERDIAPDAEYVMSDRQGLETVFRNLLDNAVRHSPEGEVVIVRGVREGDVCVYEVRDFGAGVPKGLEGRIFERFYRAPEVRNAHRGGSGLGLALCHHTLRAHGGSIEVVAPEDGAGAVFRFTLRAADFAEEGETPLS